MTIINTVENSLIDLEKKGSLDIAFEIYNPNNYFKKVYHITYFYKDKKIKTPDNIEIISPWYFKFLYNLKKFKALKIIFYPFVYIMHIIFLSVFININKIDVARGRMPYLMSLALAISSKINGIPFVVSLGGDNRLAQEKIGKYHLFNLKWLSYWVETKVLNLAKVIFVPNIYTKNYVNDIANVKDIKIIPLPLRKSFFEEGSRFLDIKRKNYFLFVGRLVGDKHPDFLILVFKKYLEKSQDKKINLKLIGNGLMLEELKKLVEKLNIQNRVEFLGFKEANEIKKYIQEAKVSLIPVSGFVIYEAAVFGNPIITSDIEWHSEFIEHKKCGWVCKYLDDEEWSNCLLDIMNKYNSALKIASKVKEKMKKMNPEVIFNKEILIYEELIKNEYS